MGSTRASTRRRKGFPSELGKPTSQEFQLSELHRRKVSMQTNYNRSAILFLAILSISLIPHSPVSHHPLQLAIKSIGKTDSSEWAHDYETRLFAAELRGRGQALPVHVRWLHAPKTGTSFANTLIRWGCPNSGETFITPRKERPANLTHPLTTTHSWDWLFLNASGRSWLRAHCTPRLARHRGDRIRYAFNMHKGLERWEVRHAAGLFRLPLQRVYSNYVHLSKHYNENRAPRESIASFVTRTEFWSQQSKLLLGRHYRDQRVLTDEDVRNAVMMVKSMLFVGLTEHFQLSCRLFHAMLGGVPHQAQFENVRPGINRYRNQALRAADFRYDEAVFNGWRDKADDVVYEAARDRFWKDVQRYATEIEKDGLGPVQFPP